MTRSPDQLLALLNVEDIGGDHFVGRGPIDRGRHLFGGQAIAQALSAMMRTTPPDRPVHSLHAYFVLAGDAREPVTYEVARLRDGGSFNTRRCDAQQNGEIIFTAAASFHKLETGFEHFAAPPDAPAPEDLPSISDLAERFQAFLPGAIRNWVGFDSPLDMRVVAPETFFTGVRGGGGRQLIWFRMCGPLPDSQPVHTALLAYFSDMTLLNAALAAHGRLIFDPAIQAASLDHALWFHQPFRVDDWLLYAQESPEAAGARALTRGQIFTRDGRMVASVTQEGLIRLRTRPATVKA